MVDRDPRSGEIHQALEARRVQETKIIQKVNAAHREAFREKFPGQIEHILRLIAERLQLGLRKDQAVPLSDSQLRDLSRAMSDVYEIYRDIHPLD